MEIDTNSELFKKASSFFKDLDILFDLYDLSIVWISEKCSELLGYSASELIGKTDFFIHGLSEGEIREIQAKLMRNEDKTVTYTTPAKTKSGKTIDVNVSNVFFKLKNDPYVVTKVNY